MECTAKTVQYVQSVLGHGGTRELNKFRVDFEGKPVYYDPTDYADWVNESYVCNNITKAIRAAYELGYNDGSND